ncbi:MAG: hypothetical protein IKI93_13135, partial [Clostridia bacterium]|nr:hypothetical protein [Clostridia bacterium]
MALIFKCLSALEKCFMDESIESKTEYTSASVLRGEEFAFQIAYTADEKAYYPRKTFRITAEHDLGAEITFREVVSVPVRVPCYADTDDDYLRKTPGLYPDLLAPVDPNGNLYATYGVLKSLYAEIRIPEDADAGDHAITLRFTADDGSETVIVF